MAISFLSFLSARLESRVRLEVPNRSGPFEDGERCTIEVVNYHITEKIKKIRQAAQRQQQKSLGCAVCSV